MPRERAYGLPHRERKAELMAALPPGACCPGCNEPFERGKIDLHHSDPENKRRGLPGDTLLCQRCNRATYTGWAAGKKPAEPAEPAEPATVPMTAACLHSVAWRAESRYGDTVRCGSCHGFTPSNARQWPDPAEPPRTVAVLRRVAGKRSGSGWRARRGERSIPCGYPLYP